MRRRKRGNRILMAWAVLRGRTGWAEFTTVNGTRRFVTLEIR